MVISRRFLVEQSSVARVSNQLSVGCLAASERFRPHAELLRNPRHRRNLRRVFFHSPWADAYRTRVGASHDADFADGADSAEALGGRLRTPRGCGCNGEIDGSLTRKRKAAYEGGLSAFQESLLATSAEPVSAAGRRPTPSP